MVLKPAHAKLLSAKVLGLNLIAVIVAILLSIPFERSVGHEFGEGGLITYFSAIQLFILSRFCYKVFRLRSHSVKAPWRSSIAIWGIMSLGFSFLALDDLLMIHEWFDKVIHGVAQIEETGLTDRIDDLIVGLYGLIAIGLLVYYRHELKRYRKVGPYVVAGFAFLFLMVGVDALTNRNDVLKLVFPREIMRTITTWDAVLEESLKIFSEAFLIVAAYLCYRKAQQLNPKGPYAIENEGIPIIKTSKLDEC